MIVKIAVLGCGTVGSGFLEIFQRQLPVLNKQFNCDCQLVGILAREPLKYQSLLFADLIKTDFNDLMAEKPDLVIELIGGIEPAKTYIETAIAQGCHIITANKDLLAVHGAHLFALAKSKEVTIGFEASVGGGIPIIKPLKNALRFSGVEQINGIVNGTCNYILTRMTEDDLSYPEALTEAMNSGFAESNPYSDVSGLDSARKLCVLATLAFSKQVTPVMVSITGIDGLDRMNIQLAKANGMKLKLVAHATAQEKGIYCVVKPCIVSPCHPFYNIDQEYNSIQLKSSDFGALQFSGKGAGKLPTGSAVFGDLIDFLNGAQDQSMVYSDDTHMTYLALSPKPQTWILQMITNPTADELGRILQTFSDHRLSIQQHPEVPGMQLEIDSMMETELLERLSLISEWCPQVNLLPLLKLS